MSFAFLKTDQETLRIISFLFVSLQIKSSYQSNFILYSSTVSMSEQLISAHLARPTAGFRPSPSPQASPAVGCQPILDNISEGSKLQITLCHILSMDVIYGFLTENNQQVAEMQTRLNAPGVMRDSGQSLNL